MNDLDMVWGVNGEYHHTGTDVSSDATSHGVCSLGTRGVLPPILTLYRVLPTIPPVYCVSARVCIVGNMITLCCNPPVSMVTCL